jgi:hypothetical protein
VTRALHGMTCFPKMVRLQRSGAFVPRASTSSPADPCAVPSDTAPVQSVACTSVGTTPHGTSPEEHVSAGVPDTIEGQDKSKRRRQILAARAVRRSRSKEACAHAAAITEAPIVDIIEASAEEHANAALEEAEAGTADTHYFGILKEQRLPTLTGSRSSSAKSIRLASEVSPVALGKTRFSADSAVSLLAESSSTAPRANIPGLPTFSAYSFGGIGKPGTSTSQGMPPVAPGFWTSLAGGCGPGAENSLHGTGIASAYPNASLLGRRCSSVPPAGNGKPPDCLLELSVAGSGIAIQRCKGVAAARGKLRSARGDLPRAPAVCA